MNGELEEKLYIHKDELDYPSFIPVPIELIKGDEFREVSASAKLLYGLLLSRTYIANKNGMIDEKGRIFLYMTLEEVMETFSVSLSKAKNMFRELSNINGKGIGLVIKNREPGRPSKIYVLKFTEVRNKLTPSEGNKE